MIAAGFVQAYLLSEDVPYPQITRGGYTPPRGRSGMPEDSVASPPPNPPCRRGPGFLTVISAFMLFCLAGGGASIWMAFRVEHSLQRRLAALAMAGIVLLFPAMFAFTSLRRKLTKGRWLPNEEDIATQREKDFRRVQSPVVRRLIVALQIFAGILLTAVWGFTDVHVVRSHGLLSGWMLYCAGLQIVLFWTYWKACRKSLTMPGWKKQVS